MFLATFLTQSKIVKLDFLQLWRTFRKSMLNQAFDDKFSSFNFSLKTITFGYYHIPFKKFRFTQRLMTNILLSKPWIELSRKVLHNCKKPIVKIFYCVKKIAKNIKT